MDITVLVTTMHRDNLDFIDEMHTECRTLVANQAETSGYENRIIHNNEFEMITTRSRGLSRNRNIAISHACSEYILFADDDLIFENRYNELIQEEFKKHPNADAIKFGVQSINPERPLSYKAPGKTIKATIKNVTSAGVVALVVKREFLETKQLYFHEKFGSGTELYCGEDTIFLNQLLRKGGVLYLSSKNIAKVKQDGSSWFKGYNEKYFHTVGTVLGYLYPKLSYAIAIRSSYKFSKRKTSLNIIDIYKCYCKGISCGRNMR